MPGLSFHHCGGSRAFAANEPCIVKPNIGEVIDEHEPGIEKEDDRKRRPDLNFPLLFSGHVRPAGSQSIYPGVRLASNDKSGDHRILPDCTHVTLDACG